MCFSRSFETIKRQKGNRTIVRGGGGGRTSFIKDSFHWSGNVPVEIDVLKMCCRAGTMKGAVDLRSREEILSGPLDVQDEMSWRISSWEQSSSGEQESGER